MASRLVLITGPPGVGKTTVARLLFERLDSAAWLDGDDVWRIRPFEVTERTRAIVETNVPHVLRTYLEAGYATVILSWVLHRADLIEGILERVGGGIHDVRIFTLLASERALSERFERDPSRGPVTAVALQRLAQARAQETEQLDTTGLDPGTVVDRIVAHLGARQ